jgi:hypothetical protein
MSKCREYQFNAKKSVGSRNDLVTNMNPGTILFGLVVLLLLALFSLPNEMLILFFLLLLLLLFYLLCLRFAVFLSALAQAGSELQMLGGAAGGFFPYAGWWRGEERRKEWGREKERRKEKRGAEKEMYDDSHIIFRNYTTYFTGEFISLYTSFVLPEYLHNVSTDQVCALFPN